MNEPQTRNPDQEVKISSHVIAAPMIKRMVAFTMDLILLLLLLLLTATLLLKFSNPEVSAQLDNLSQEFFTIAQNQKIEAEESQKHLEQLITPEITNFMNSLGALFVLIPVTFFFLGEKFFSGKSFGKATFGLKSVRTTGDGCPTTFKSFVRAFIKGTSITVFFPYFFILNFGFCFFNRDRKCLHDLASGSITVEENFSNEEQE